jgi:hypothetical protein
MGSWTIISALTAAPSAYVDITLPSLWLVEISNGEGKLVFRGKVRMFNQPASWT